MAKKFPQALPDQDEVGKRGPLHQISGWMVSLGYCVPQFGAGECLCVFKYLRVLKYFDFIKNPHDTSPRAECLEVLPEQECPGPKVGRSALGT